MRYPNLTIKPHTLASCPSRLPEPGEILLWRLRGEWQLVTSERGHLYLSKAELRRARTHPNRAHGRRFAIGRSALRAILGTLAGRAADALTLIDRDADHIAVAGCDLLDGLDVVIGHAGIWIVIAIARGPIGLGIAQTSALADPVSRDQLRLDSLSNACGTGHGATLGSLAPLAGAFREVDTPHAGRWRLLDIPLSGWPARPPWPLAGWTGSTRWAGAASGKTGWPTAIGICGRRRGVVRLLASRPDDRGDILVSHACATPGVDIIDGSRSWDRTKVVGYGEPAALEQGDGSMCVPGMPVIDAQPRRHVAVDPLSGDHRTRLCALARTSRRLLTQSQSSSTTTRG